MTSPRKDHNLQEASRETQGLRRSFNKPNQNKERKAKGACFTCGGQGAIWLKIVLAKSDKGKAKIKKEATSNRIEPEIEYEEVYINTLEVESYASAKTARPPNIKPHTMH